MIIDTTLRLVDRAIEEFDNSEAALKPLRDWVNFTKSITTGCKWFVPEGDNWTPAPYGSQSSVLSNCGLGEQGDYVNNGLVKTQTFSAYKGLSKTIVVNLDIDGIESKWWSLDSE